MRLSLQDFGDFGGDLLKEYANKIVNIQPSLIPSFAVTALRIESTSGAL